MNIVLFVLAAMLALCIFFGLSASRERRAILRLLADGQWWYGLDLVKRSRGDLGRGSVYVRLCRLEERGFVTSRLDPTPPSRPGLLPRRQYRITDAGRRARKRSAVRGSASGQLVSSAST